MKVELNAIELAWIKSALKTEISMIQSKARSAKWANDHFGADLLGDDERKLKALLKRLEEV